MKERRKMSYEEKQEFRRREERDLPRKQRKKEREERIRIEKSIDSKPVSEIEAELRAEIEKDRLERQQAVEEAREMHVEEEPVSQEEDQK